MLEEFIKHQNYLIDLEHQEEVNQLINKINSLSGKLCQHDGLSILHLEIESMRTAMFGRCCVSLHKIDSSPISQSFKVGDEVCFYNPKLKSSTNPKEKSSNNDNDNKNILNGLISKITMYKIDIIIDEQFQVNEHLYEPPLRVDLRSSQKTHITMKSAMQQLQKKDAEYHPLVQLLFYPNETTQYSLLNPSIKEFTSLNIDMNSTSYNNETIIQDIDGKCFKHHQMIWNESLNNSQRNAISCALFTPSVAIIHGPPGTGKTSTLTELVIQAVHRNMKVLVCAPSNIAVDTILGRLADYKNKNNNKNNNKNKTNNKQQQQQLLSVNLQMVRIGHPARISKKIMQYSLDALISKDEGTEILFDVRKDIDNLRNEMTKKKYDRNRSKDSNSCTTGITGRGDDTPLTRNQQRSELKQLCKEAREREKAVVKRIINRSNVVLCTCVGASSRLLEGDLVFDMVIIDEAAQGLEAACWVPLLKGKKAILAGDHCQLPPTIKCMEADKGGLSVTLFERIIKDHRFKDVVCLLDTQYRMNALISDWASKNMYHGAIHSHPSVANHKLDDLLHHNNHNTEILKLENTNKSDEDDDDDNKDKEDDAVSDIIVGLGLEQPSTLKAVTAFPVLLLIDTSSCGMMEDISITQEASKHGGSHCNFHEADLVQKHVYALVKAGVKPSQIGVITPYNAQLDVIRELLLPTSSYSDSSSKDNEVVGDVKNKNKSIHLTQDKSIKNKLIPKSLSIENNVASEISLQGLEIKTIDGFQGGEKECILLSLVRSNPTHTVGFLGEKRRINVAVTRAKRHLAVFCDSDTCRIDPFIRNLLDHMAENGDHVSADEYIDYISTGGNENTIGTGDSHKAKEGYSSLNTGSFKTFNSKTKSNATHLNQEKIALVKQDFNVLLQYFKSKKLLRLENNEEYIFINNTNTIATTNRSISITTNQTTILIRLIASSQTSFVHLDKDSSVIAPNRESIDVKYLISEEIIRFPGSINSYQRMLIHECADELQLYHRSSNTITTNATNNNNNIKSKLSSKDRFIEVSLNEFLIQDPLLPLLLSSQQQQVDSIVIVTTNQSTSNDNESTSANVVNQSSSSSNIQLNYLTTNILSKNYEENERNIDLLSINNIASSSVHEHIIISNEKQLDHTNIIIKENMSKLSMGESLTNNNDNSNNNSNNDNNSNDNKNNINKNINYVKKTNVTNSNNKVYISKARASYQDLMEKNILKKLNSTENANDEDALIEAAILHNQELAHYNQYKVGSIPMPNPDKLRNKELIRNKLVEAAISRQKKSTATSTNRNSSNNKSEQTPSTSNNSNSRSIGTISSFGSTNIHGFLSTTTNNTSNGSSTNTKDNNKSNSNDSSNKKKKLVKKPPPNFGGGKLGTS